MPAEKIAKAPKLLHIARNGAGYDTIDLPSCTSRGIVVTNCPGGNAFAVAELTVGLMLAIQRRIIESDRKVRRGERLKSIQLLAPGLRGNVIGLVGMGSIAWETAKILHFAFGCKILVLSPTSPATRWTSKDPNGLDPIPHTRVDSLEELLPQVDILSLHCPLTTATRDMISTEQLKAMKSTAVVINTARGGMVDERALETALRTGEIAGAALDVWKSEPPNSETIGGLGELDNIIIVPHL
jgi:D-3-phosphoglycerate dehydrogenase